MNIKVSNEIITTLKELIPNNKPELDFNNPFELICAVLLSAQTTDKRVNIVTKELFEKYPTPKALSEADYLDIYNIIVSLGLAKNKAANLIKLGKAIYEVHNNEVPNELDKLITLPGVGRKTALVVLALAFNIPGIPVDTHVHRMAIRLGYISPIGSVLDAEKAFMKYIPKEQWIDAHHLFLLFGRYYCKAINPKCMDCRLKSYCKK